MHAITFNTFIYIQQELVLAQFTISSDKHARDGHIHSFNSFMVDIWTWS